MITTTVMGPSSRPFKDGQAVLCDGMGWRAADELRQNGIQAFVIPAEMSFKDAVEVSFAGNLGAVEVICRCHE
ncbi:MAG: hypothetical protein ACYC4N_12550 [Pirellulaceae bacterium]